MDASPESWTANLLRGAPLIAPARQFTWPQSIPGEEDALARGAVRVQVRPREGAPFLLTCALGFKEPSLPTGIYPCPHPDWICVLAGGYAYLADATRDQARGSRPPCRWPVALYRLPHDAGLGPRGAGMADGQSFVGRNPDNRRDL
jgi:hypothetical protein